MTIRAARPDDVPALRDIERAAGQLFAEIGMREVADDEPLSEDVLLGYQRAGMAWVATNDTDRPVGYVLAEVLTEMPTSSSSPCYRPACGAASAER